MQVNLLNQEINISFLCKVYIIRKFGMHKQVKRDLNKLMRDLNFSFIFLYLKFFTCIFVMSVAEVIEPIAMQLRPLRFAAELTTIVHN